MNPTHRRVRRTIAGLIATGVCLVASGCGSDDGGTTESGIEVVSEGELTVCTHLPYKPFQFRDDSGEVVGFDTDLLNLLAEDLDLDVSVVDIEWNQIITGAAFSAQKCDIGMGAMTITPERDKTLLISDPYFKATQALLVRKADAQKYQSLEDLEGEELGTQTDTTGQIYGDEHAEEHGYETRVYEDGLSSFNAVKSGQIAAAINDNGVLYDFAKINDDTTVTAEFDTGEEYGFAALTGDDNAQKLMDRLNEVLAQAKKDGTYDKIYKKWFGKAPSDG